jgi:hypothetical protein
MRKERKMAIRATRNSGWAGHEIEGFTVSSIFPRQSFDHTPGGGKFSAPTNVFAARFLVVAFFFRTTRV